MKLPVFLLLLICVGEIKAGNLLDAEKQKTFERRLQADGFVLHDHGNLKRLKRSRLAAPGVGILEKIDLRPDSSGDIYALRSCITCSLETTKNTTKNLEASKNDAVEDLISIVFPSEQMALEVRSFILKNRNSTTPTMQDFEGVRVKVEARNCGVWWRWRIEMSIS